MAGMLAIANVGRAAAFRSGYFLRNVVPVWINGAARSGVIQQSLRIDLNTGEEPHRCSFDLKGGSGFVPQAGQSCVIGHGSTSNPLFAGRLAKVGRTTIRNADTKPVYCCEAIGHVFELDMARVANGFEARSLSPRSIVLGVMAVSTPALSSFGFSAEIPSDLPYVGEFSTGPGESIPQAFGRMFRNIDAIWHVDHERVIRAFGGVNSHATAPSTITHQTATVWGVNYKPTDITRVFTTVMVKGASQPTLADVDTTIHAAAPLASASLLGTYAASSELISDADFLVGFELRTEDTLRTPEGHFRAGNVSVFLPAPKNTNTLTVAASNVSSASPLVEERWYDIAGQSVYVSSVLGVYSLTASSVAYHYYLPTSASGCLNTDIPPAAPVTGLWNYVFNTPPALVSRYLPAGTNIQVLAQGVANVNEVGSLVGNGLTFLNLSKVVEDGRLSAAGALTVRDELLPRGAPSAWRSIEFKTRDELYEIGAPVYVSITSPAEPGGHSIVGAFTAHDVTIGDFGRLTETRGPVRSVRAGTVRRPTLWQVLQGDE